MDNLDNNSRPHISRRDFLKLAGVTAAAGVAASGGLSLNDLQNSKEHKFKEDQIKVGNLTLTPIVTEHDDKTWQKNGAQILKDLEPFSIIIPEYFPPEYTNVTKGNPLFEHFDHLNYGFTEIAKWCKDNQKDIYVVDPAYSMDAVKLRIMENKSVIGIFTVGGMAGSIINGGISRHLQDKENGDLTNNQAVGNVAKDILLGTIASGGFGGFIATTGSSVNEVDFRHVFTARSLKILGGNVPEGTRAAIIYPTAHWNGMPNNNISGGELLDRGIKYYLTHPNELEEQATIYQKQYSPENYPDLYKIRRYEQKNEVWVKLP